MLFVKSKRFVGKHAKYIKFLNAYTRVLDKEENTSETFAYAVDVYLIAPLIGVAYNRRSPIDNENDELSINAEQIIPRQNMFENVYRLVMLTEKSTNLSSDERIERAFRDDEDVEKLSANMDLFHQYVHGGIEWLFENISNGASTQNDYLEKIKEIVKLFSDDFEINTANNDFKNIQ
jgi:hypothetical protein